MDDKKKTAQNPEGPKEVVVVEGEKKPLEKT